MWLGSGWTQHRYPLPAGLVLSASAYHCNPVLGSVALEGKRGGCVVWFVLAVFAVFILLLTPMTSHQFGDFSYHYFLCVPELAFVLENCRFPAGEWY